MMSFLERQFKISERGSSIKTEILSGIVTFVTMSYIIFVNPDTLSKTGMDLNALVVATCVASALTNAALRVSSFAYLRRSNGLYLVFEVTPAPCASIAI